MGWLAAYGFLNVFNILMWRQSRLVINLFSKMAEFVLSEAEVEDNVCDDECCAWREGKQ